MACTMIHSLSMASTVAPSTVKTASAPRAARMQASSKNSLSARMASVNGSRTSLRRTAPRAGESRTQSKPGKK